MTGKFTGRHMATILIAFFAIVFAVNFTMARYASATFGGTVVDNSYVASQQFNGWLAKARAEQALGWSIAVSRGGDERLIASLEGTHGPMVDASIAATARHPLGRVPDIALRFRSLGDGRHESIQPLPAGRWIVHVRVTEQGRQVSKLVDIQ